MEQYQAPIGGQVDNQSRSQQKHDRHPPSHRRRKKRNLRFPRGDRPCHVTRPELFYLRGWDHNKMPGYLDKLTKNLETLKVESLAGSQFFKLALLPE